MSWRTEDLLSLRDDEPMDAELRMRLLTDPAASGELASLRSMREALRVLPDPEPPPHVWERIRADLDAMPPARRPGATFRRWCGGGAMAASVALAALWLLGGQPGALDDPELPPSTTVSTPTGNDRPLAPVNYASLVAESERLERMLGRLPAQRSLMNASTAQAIAGLEDRIAWLDQQITLAAARGVAPEQRMMLWNQRVEMMNALLHVRYAQAQDAGF